MGSSPTGILAYGFDIGGRDNGWKLKGLGEYGEWRPVWLVTDATTTDTKDAQAEDPDEDEYDEDDELDGVDIVDECEERLLTMLGGFTETDWQAEGYYERKREAQKRVGVELRAHGHYEYRAYFLCAHEESVGDYGVMALDLPGLAACKIEEDWDGRLRRACKALGIEPEQEQPQWWLGSFYS